MSAGDDFQEIVDLAIDLGNAPKKVIPLVRKVMEDSGDKLAEDWSKNAKGPSGRHAKKYPKTIFARVDLKRDGEIAAIIQPRRGGAGNLGEVLELPGGGIRSAPQQAGRKALRDNEKDIERKLLDAAEDALDL
jgi:hypothetical protein